MNYQLNTKNVNITTEIVVESLNINFNEKYMLIITTLKTYDNNVEDLTKRKTIKLRADNTVMVNKYTGEKNPIMKSYNSILNEFSGDGLLPNEICGEYDFYENYIQNQVFDKNVLIETIINNAKNENRFI